MKPKRSLWVYLFGIPALLVLPLALIGSRVYSAGSIEVQVAERGGCTIGMEIPAVLVNAGLLALPHIDVDLESELDGEARQALRIARAAVDELERCPDGVFVDVMCDNEIVTIEKKDGRVIILVDTPDERVRCSMPLAVCGKALRTLSAI